MDEINLNNFPSIDPDDQIEVIQSLFDMGNTRKALEVCDIALKYHPNNTALAILKNTLFENLKQESSKEIDLKPNDLKHKKLLIHRIESIANVFSKANKTQDAITLYTILKTIDKENFLACFRLGQIYFDNNTFAQAIKEFKSANTIDPFHIFTLKKLGLACYILGETFDALKYWMDGLILTIPTQNQEDIVFFKTHIRNAQNKVAGFNKSDRNMLFKKRQKRLRQLINDLKSALPSNTTVDVSDSLDHWFVADEDQDLSMNSSSTKMTSLADLPETSQVSVVQEFKKDPDLKFHKSNEELKEIAEKLNQYTLFKNLSPQERLTIANFTSFISLREDAYVFHENEPCYGIYFIERGLIEYSNQNFNLFFTEGQLFGHENILIHEKSMFTAKVKQECDLVFIDKAGLALIFSRNKPLAMHFLWYFWKSLSFQYQELKHILYQHYAGTPYVKAKIEYLPSTQLKQKQIHTLSSVCGFNIKAKDTVLFDYGDSPSSMYVLIEGEIHLIHKSLTSHVENGQYFAEAALMDKSFNSTYQAKVIKNGSKIIKISRDILHNLIEKDESTAYEFLSIVCKMFAYKLQTLKKLA